MLLCVEFSVARAGRSAENIITHPAGPDFRPAGDPRSKRKVGTQSEVPTIKFAANGTRLIVDGYQKFELYAETPGQPVVHHYERKFAYIKSLLTRFGTEEGCHSLIDIGCSAGLISLIGKGAGMERIDSLDHDPEYIGIVRKISAWANIGEIRPREFNFGAALPAPADVVICGALIHWVFCRTADFHNSFDRIFDYLLAAVRPGKFLVIEWITDDKGILSPKWWPERCFKNESRKSSSYSRAGFEAAGLRRADLVEQAAPESKSRIFYVFRKRHEPGPSNPAAADSSAHLRALSSTASESANDKSPCSLFDPAHAEVSKTFDSTAGDGYVESRSFMARQAATYSLLNRPLLWSTCKHHVPAMSLNESWLQVARCQDIGLVMSGLFAEDGSHHTLFTARWRASTAAKALASSISSNVARANGNEDGVEVILKCENLFPTPALLAQRPREMLVLPCRVSFAASHKYGVCIQTLKQCTATKKLALHGFCTKGTTEEIGRRCSIEERLLPLRKWDVLRNIQPNRVNLLMMSLVNVFLELRTRNLTFSDGGMHQFCIERQFRAVKLCDHDSTAPPGRTYKSANPYGPPEYYHQNRLHKSGKARETTSFQGDVYVLGSILTSIQLIKDGIYTNTSLPSGSMNMSSFFCLRTSWSRISFHFIPCEQDAAAMSPLRPARGLCIRETAWETDAQLGHWARMNPRMAELIRLMCKPEPVHRPEIANVAHLMARVK